MEEINIEYGMPTVAEAMPLLAERLRSLKKSGVKAVNPRLRLDREGGQTPEGHPYAA